MITVMRKTYIKDIYFPLFFLFFSLHSSSSLTSSSFHSFSFIIVQTCLILLLATSTSPLNLYHSPTPFFNSAFKLLLLSLLTQHSINTCFPLHISTFSYLSFTHPTHFLFHSSFPSLYPLPPSHTPQHILWASSERSTHP